MLHDGAGASTSLSKQVASSGPGSPLLGHRLGGMNPALRSVSQRSLFNNSTRPLGPPPRSVPVDKQRPKTPESSPAAPSRASTPTPRSAASSSPILRQAPTSRSGSSVSNNKPAGMSLAAVRTRPQHSVADDFPFDTYAVLGGQAHPIQSRPGSVVGLVARSSSKHSIPTNDRLCSTLDTLCDECSRIRNRISPLIHERYLYCPQGVYPITIKGILFGTPKIARDITSELSVRVRQFTNAVVPVHAAVRRAATPRHREGHWYDLTTSGKHLNRSSSDYSKASSFERSVGCAEHDSNPGLLDQVFYWHWKKKAEGKGKKQNREIPTKTKADKKSEDKRSSLMNYEDKDRHYDLRILLDFPMPIDRDGPVANHIVTGLPSTITKFKVGITESHHTLDRLSWWARIHPAGHRRRTSLRHESAHSLPGVDTQTRHKKAALSDADIS
ncbi:hypothetical protein BJX76DRAFT_332288 [Aspergillus varians]